MQDLPSMEIVCVGSTEPTPIEAAGFVVECELGLKAQSAASRFQAAFDQSTGCLYRLGARVHRPRQGAALSAYDLLGIECRDRFPPSLLEFATQHVAAVADVLAQILALSPRREALFTTDWPFGPEWSHRFGPITVEEFWRLHESRALYLNTAYAVVP